jgi:diaminopimelate epimerase
MPAPRDWRLHRRLCLDGVEHGYHFVNTGVPHAVLFPDTPPDAAAVHAVGARVRQHADFAPQGTNVDFVTVLGPSEIAVRTYERGVEAETLACGSGITASALVAGRLGRVAPPVSVRSAGGDRLTVDFELLADGAAHVSLLGPAVQVYTGEVSRS